MSNQKNRGDLGAAKIQYTYTSYVVCVLLSDRKASNHPPSLAPTAPTLDWVELWPDTNKA